VLDIGEVIANYRFARRQNGVKGCIAETTTVGLPIHQLNRASDDIREETQSKGFFLVISYLLH